MTSWSKRSLGNLEGVHPDLVKVCNLALTIAGSRGLDFALTDGCRTLAEQVRFVAEGKSKTMHSRHLNGHAVDFVALVNRRASYDESAMGAIAECFKAAATQLGIEIGWGGDWHSFQDTPHIELDRTRYPDVQSV